MSEAPEKIYHEANLGTFGYDQEPEDTVYIRADLVDELVEALERMVRALEWDKEVKEKDWWPEDRARAKAALAKARGEV